MTIDWTILGMAVPLLAKGALVTLEISAAAIVIGIVVGIGLGLLALSHWGFGRWFVRRYVDFIRGTPLLIQIFVLFFVLPVVGIRLSETWAGILALGFNCAGYVSEIVRGTIGAIETGQTEAARSIGLLRWQTLVYVLLPQSLRPIVPPLTNELITLVKNSSLLSVISVYELTRAGQSIITTYFVPLEIYLLLAIYYYVIITALARLSALLERKLPSW